MKEHDGAVLRSDVGALAIDLSGIVVRPEDVQQLLVGHPRRVEGHLDDLGVVGVAGAYLAVGRFGRVSARVAHPGGLDPLALAIGGLDTPETTGSEGRGLVVRLLHTSDSLWWWRVMEVCRAGAQPTESPRLSALHRVQRRRRGPCSSPVISLDGRAPGRGAGVADARTAPREGAGAASTSWVFRPSCPADWG